MAASTAPRTFLDWRVRPGVAAARRSIIQSSEPRLGPIAHALACALLAAMLGCGAGGFEWERASPVSEGLLPDAFARFADEVARRDTDSLWVVRNGKLVHEWHDWGDGRRTRHHTASLAKGVVGGLSLAALVGEGRLSLDEAASVHVPRWRSDPARSRITLGQLATPGLGRYLMALGFDAAGGWGIFEAPEPWGPWRTEIP